MKCFHRSPAGESILKNGFRNGEGTYMTGIMHRGVWLSDRPLDFGQGAKGDDVLLLDIPADVLQPYEWVEEGKPYREFLIPAETVNQYGPPELVDEDDYDWNDESEDDDAMFAEEKICGVIVVLTNAAQGAGLPAERAEAVYSELLERFKLMQDGFAEALLADIRKVLEHGGISP